VALQDGDQWKVSRGPKRAPGGSATPHPGQIAGGLGACCFGRRGARRQPLDRRTARERPGMARGCLHNHTNRSASCETEIRRGTRFLFPIGLRVDRPALSPGVAPAHARLAGDGVLAQRSHRIPQSTHPRCGRQCAHLRPLLAALHVSSPLVASHSGRPSLGAGANRDGCGATACDQCSARPRPARRQSQIRRARGEGRTPVKSARKIFSRRYQDAGLRQHA
jgi:hypothetical protein